MSKIVMMREKLARQILVFNLLLLAIIVIYYIFHGFDMEEMTGLVALISSLAAIYIGTLSKYLGGIIKNVRNKSEKVNQPPLAKILQLIVPCHYLLILAIISCKAFTIITYTEMNLFLTILEVSFGGYVGYIISSIFDTENNKR
jgi:hypothetical protein